MPEPQYPHMCWSGVFACVGERLLGYPVERRLKLSHVAVRFAPLFVARSTLSSTSSPCRRARSARSSTAAWSPRSSSATGRRSVISARRLSISACSLVDGVAHQLGCGLRVAAAKLRRDSHPQRREVLQGFVVQLTGPTTTLLLGRAEPLVAAFRPITAAVMRSLRSPRTPPAIADHRP